MRKYIQYLKKNFFSQMNNELWYSRQNFSKKNSRLWIVEKYSIPCSKKMIFLIVLSVLFIFVFFFEFLAIIPEKEYSLHQPALEETQKWKIHRHLSFSLFCFRNQQQWTISSFKFWTLYIYSRVEHTWTLIKVILIIEQ